VKVLLALRQGWRGDLAAFVAGAAMPLAFAPVGLAWLAMLCLAILFHSWQEQSMRRAARRGYLFGLGMFGVGTSWVIVSIHEFGHTPLWLAILLTVIFVAFLALYPALLGAIVVRARLMAGLPGMLLGLPSAWVLVEWLRGWLFTGFPWLSIGYTQTDSVLAGYAPLLGSYAISLVIAVLAACLVVLVSVPGRVAKLVALATVILVVLAGGMLQRLQFVSPMGKPVEVALLQGNVAQDEKWLPGMREVILDRYRDMTDAVMGTPLIIWPETAVPDFYHNAVNDYLADITRRAEEAGSDLLIGVPILEYQGIEPTYYNSVVSLGGEFAVYHKRHLVPFGEYVPLGNLLRLIGGVFNLPMSDFSSGESAQTRLPGAGLQLGVTICYEDVFGNETAAALPQASVLVNVSNDAWFGDSLAPHQHLQMARMRAIETGRPMLRSTNTGISALIDHEGRITTRSPQFEIHTLRGQVQPMQGATPYVRFTDIPLIFLALGLLGFAVLLGRRRYVRAGDSA
jgi:apolipoprotein N-acyltransferase